MWAKFAALNCNGVPTGALGSRSTVRQREVFHDEAGLIIFPGMGNALTKQVGNGRFHVIPDEKRLCVFRHGQEVLRTATPAAQETEWSRASA